mgnify:CR=1 FL=1
MRISVVLDCLDPDALVPFWQEALAYQLVDSLDGYRILAPRDSVAFAAEGAWIDVLALKGRCATGLGGAPLEELLALGVLAP